MVNKVGNRLEIVIYPSRVKSWRYRFTLDGKLQNPYAIGRYPDLSLSEARVIRAELATLSPKALPIATLPLPSQSALLT